MKFHFRYIVLFFFSFFLFSFSFAQTFTITSSVTNVTCYGGNDGTASVVVSGGVLPYSYTWSDALNQTTPTATGLIAGTYSVDIFDNTGYDSIISVFVSQPLKITDNSLVQAPVCSNNGYIVLSPSGGTPPYQFLWNTGESVSGITKIGAGDFSVSITDAKNCTQTFSYSLAEEECFVSPEPFFTPNDDQINDTWYIANAQYFDNAHVIVFDRWGTRVYEHKGLYESWDGKNYFGIPVPVSVYYYFFYQDKDDKQKNAKRGSVTIMR